MRAASALSSRTRAPVSLWWQLTRRSYHRMSTYRAATAAGVFTNSVFGFLRAYVFLAVLDARPGLAGYDAADAITYTFVTQGLLATVYAFGDTDIALRIRSGDIVSDLYRPVDFQGYWLATDIGRGGFQLLFRGVPPVLIGALAFELTLPASAGTWLGFLVSVWLGVVVSFAIRYLASISGFWLLDVRGVWQITSAVTMFLAGMIVPLGFLPDGLATFTRWLPFAAMSQLPIDLLLGEHHGWGSTLAILARQAMWATILLGVGRLVTRRAFRKVVVQGG